MRTAFIALFVFTFSISVNAGNLRYPGMTSEVNNYTDKNIDEVIVTISSSVDNLTLNRNQQKNFGRQETTYKAKISNGQFTIRPFEIKWKSTFFDSKSLTLDVTLNFPSINYKIKTRGTAYITIMGDYSMMARKYIRRDIGSLSLYPTPKIKSRVDFDMAQSEFLRMKSDRNFMFLDSSILITFVESQKPFDIKLNATVEKRDINIQNNLLDFNKQMTSEYFASKVDYGRNPEIKAHLELKTIGSGDPIYKVTKYMNLEDSFSDEFTKIEVQN